MLRDVSRKVYNGLWQRIVNWLLEDVEDSSVQSFSHFDHLLSKIQPADVILFDGTTRVSQVIKIVTLSPWTHAALYIGRLHDIRDEKARKQVEKFYQGDPNEPLIIESLLGQGTVINPLSRYKLEHIRVCRPSRLSYGDMHQVTSFAIEHLGIDYDVRQLLDLARLMFPYALLPRKWRSSLFQHNAGKPTHIVCSSMIARCFQQVYYPVLPVIKNDKQDRVRFYQRNFRLFVPSDFDYSPYFDVLKFANWELGETAPYRQLPWEPLPEEEHSPELVYAQHLQADELSVRRQA